MPIGTLIKIIQDIMRKDVGVDGDAQRISQMVWLLFLKIFDDKEKEWKVTIEGYKSPLQSRFQWSNWAADPEGMTGDELIDFVNTDLFPALKKLATSAGVSQHGKVVGGVFEDAYNYMKSGTLLRQVINTIQSDVDFNVQSDRHIFNDIYEKILADLQSAGNAGEYYTPRALTQFMVDIIDPKLGESILDPACGTGGFLTCAIEHLRKQEKTPEDKQTIQDCIHGVEKKPLPHMLAVTNMMLHGIDLPTNIRHDNTLSRPLKDYGPKDRVDIVITNPPFGGMEEDGIENNFPKKFKTRSTADLFLALIMHLLKHDTGRAAIILPDGFLFGEGVSINIKKELLNEFNLHTIIRMPRGVFSPYTSINTNILFFEKGEKTKHVWFFEHPYPEGYKSYSKTNPLTIQEFDLEKAWWNNRRESKYAWKIPYKEIEDRNFNLDFDNPHVTESVLEDPVKLLQEYYSLKEELEVNQELLKQELINSLKSIQPNKDIEFYIKHFNVLYSQKDTITDLKKTILTIALQGRLIPQDIDDQPACDLLRNIAAERGHYNKELITQNRLSSKTTSKDTPYIIPNNWAWCKLGDISTFHLGKTPPSQEQKYWSTDPLDHNWVSISDLVDNGIVYSTAKKVTDQAVRDVFKYKESPVGSLLMSFKLTIGKTSILGINAYHNEAIITLVPILVNKMFLFKFLPLIANTGDKSNAIKGKTLTRGKIENLWVPLPPLLEQQRIVEKVDQLMKFVNKLEEIIDKLSDKRKMLLSSIVHKVLKI